MAPVEVMQALTCIESACSGLRRMLLDMDLLGGHSNMDRHCNAANCSSCGSATCNEVMGTALSKPARFSYIL